MKRFGRLAAVAAVVVAGLAQAPPAPAGVGEVTGYPASGEQYRFRYYQPGPPERSTIHLVATPDRVTLTDTTTIVAKEPGENFCELQPPSGITCTTETFGSWSERIGERLGQFTCPECYPGLAEVWVDMGLLGGTALLEGTGPYAFTIHANLGPDTITLGQHSGGGNVWGVEALDRVDVDNGVADYVQCWEPPAELLRDSLDRSTGCT